MTDPSPALRALRLVARALRRPVRSTVWRVRARRLGEPRLPDRVQSVLFVCKGNICRSPFAEVLAERLALTAGLPDLEVGSAGLVPSTDGASPPDAAAAAVRFQVSLATHVPRPLDAATVARYDLLVVMELAQRADLLRRFPSAREKVVVLPVFEPGFLSAYDRCNIPDPFGKGSEAFDACYRRIDTAVRGLLARCAELRAPATAGRLA